MGGHRRGRLFGRGRVDEDQVRDEQPVRDDDVDRLEHVDVGAGLGGSLFQEVVHAVRGALVRQTGGGAHHELPADQLDALSGVFGQGQDVGKRPGADVAVGNAHVLSPPVVPVWPIGRGRSWCTATVTGGW